VATPQGGMNGYKHRGRPLEKSSDARSENVVLPEFKKRGSVS